MFLIPSDRLPPGFAESVDRPVTDPAPPRPAATIVLVREARGGPETLLLRRVRSSGFVPGAYVFPGGRVDTRDAEPALVTRLDGADSAHDMPEPAYLIAALREAFEETGVLLARPAQEARVLREWRDRLLAGDTDLAEMVEHLDVRLAAEDIAYIAHWITPVAEPRRYDTRFFLAEVPEGQKAEPDAREMTDALWLSAGEALGRFRAGRLPMVFPTVRTLETLLPFRSAGEAIAELRVRPVKPVLPRLVRTADGVGIVVEGEDP
jgi:8-oxo-dGTP pyrophosphatase MutT (NUDIX family)